MSDNIFVKGSPSCEWAQGKAQNLIKHKMFWMSRGYFGSTHVTPALLPPFCYCQFHGSLHPHHTFQYSPFMQLCQPLESMMLWHKMEEMATFLEIAELFQYFLVYRVCQRKAQLHSWSVPSTCYVLLP